MLKQLLSAAFICRDPNQLRLDHSSWWSIQGCHGPEKSRRYLGSLQERRVSSKASWQYLGLRGLLYFLCKTFLSAIWPLLTQQLPRGVCNLVSSHWVYWELQSDKVEALRFCKNWLCMSVSSVLSRVYLFLRENSS